MTEEKIKSEKLNVLISTLMFANLTGSEMYTFELAKKLKELNCDVTVLSNIGEPMIGMANELGIKTVSIKSPQQLSGINFDIIHTQHLPVSEFVCNSFPNIPKLSVIHSEVISLESPYIHPSIKKYITIRPEIQNHIVKNFNIDISNTEVIYNPVDPKKFNTTDTKDDGYILFVGTIDYLRKNSIFDLVEYSKSLNKELWLVGVNHGNYLMQLLSNPHVKYFDATIDVEKYVKNCSETAGILLGRTTIEGWMCGKPGWIYDIDSSGNILGKSKNEVPSDIDKFNSEKVALKIKEEYLKILNK